MDSSLEVEMDSLNASSSDEQEEPKHHEDLSKLLVMFYSSLMDVLLKLKILDYF